VAQDVRYVHHGPALRRVKAVVRGDNVVITVPFTGVGPSKDLQDFGATWRAWWSDSAPVSRFRVTLESVRVNNNLGVDNPANANNPTNKPTSAWNMYVNVGNDWVNLHDPRPGHVDYIPGLGAVPSAKPKPVSLSASAVRPFDVSLAPGAALRVFTDARECQQPGYVDCPTTELGLNGRSAGRAELSLPVEQLTGRSTTVTIHPPVCNGTGDCPEDRNPASLCPVGCYDLVYRIDDVTAAPVAQQVAGDGTSAGSTINGRPASAAGWWIAPVTRYGPDQGEENVMVARILGELGRSK